MLGTTTHVAPTMTPGVYATIDAGVAVSADGRLVAFSTLSPANVVPGPGNAFPKSTSTTASLARRSASAPGRTAYRGTAGP